MHSQLTTGHITPNKILPRVPIRKKKKFHKTQPRWHCIKKKGIEKSGNTPLARGGLPFAGWLPATHSQGSHRGGFLASNREPRSGLPSNGGHPVKGSHPVRTRAQIWAPRHWPRWPPLRGSLDLGSRSSAGKPAAPLARGVAPDFSEQENNPLKGKTMGSELHGVIGLCLSFVVISIVFRTSTSMSMSGPSDFAENNIHRRCMPNGTNSDCAVVDAGEEYLSEDEQIKFVVRPNMPREISYRALQRPPVCNAEIYGNCIVHVSPYYRPCNYYTRCIRHRGQF
ncbi:hypothetical protein CJ030_MR6G021361 [Morella rubra]|uniref:Uncharacterized protein n=1 Tax=Morella rubra TaxID=262757 RepID=A0A6A1VEZ5_9ROSI|nr:hypothetical protein CJ030_MR6G021361 [Morella rubra]